MISFIIISNLNLNNGSSQLNTLIFNTTNNLFKLFTVDATNSTVAADGCGNLYLRMNPLFPPTTGGGGPTPTLVLADRVTTRNSGLERGHVFVCTHSERKY